MIKRLAICLITAIMMTGCSQTTHKQLGLNKDSPDEFQVISRPALIIPSSYDLRPPESGGLDYDARTASDDAKAILGAGRQSTTFDNKKLTPAEANFLDQADTELKISGIRHILRQDRIAQQKAREGFWQKFKSYSPKSEHQPEPVINAQEERDRIRKALENKEPLNKTESPMIEQKRTIWDMISGGS